jgi:hypothetical protein
MRRFTGAWQRGRQIAAAGLLAALLTGSPMLGGIAVSQETPQEVCGASGNAAPRAIGQPDANGWTSDQENLANGNEVRRYRFTVKEQGTAYVYVGDQWYNLNLGLFSMTTGEDVGCWSVQVKGTSTESEKNRLQFVRPDERAIEVEPGDYILTTVAGDDALVNPARNFTVRVAVGPRVCALLPTNQPDPQYPGLTNKPENPDLFQVGMSIQPGVSELGPFSLMSFNAYLSPPFTDLFEFTWELDGQVVPGENGPTMLKPYSELSPTPDGIHSVTLTAKGAKEYQDATDPRMNVLPFNGGTRTVTCQFQGQGQP